MSIARAVRTDAAQMPKKYGAIRTAPRQRMWLTVDCIFGLALQIPFPTIAEQQANEKANSTEYPP